MSECACMNKITYQEIRSRRKTIALQITPAGELIVRCPLRMRDEDVRAFVESKSGWIAKHTGNIPQLPPYTEEEIKDLTQRARIVIPARVAYYAPLVGVTYENVTIRHQKTRWGSCSGKGNLNFNCLLMEVPLPVLDYVVVHELCHRRQMNHSRAFWAQVEKIFPDYKVRRKWLKDHGSALIGRIK